MGSVIMMVTMVVTMVVMIVVMVVMIMSAAAMIAVAFDMMVRLFPAVHVDNGVGLDLGGFCQDSSGHGVKLIVRSLQGDALLHIIDAHKLNAGQLRQGALQLGGTVGTVDLDGPGLLHDDTTFRIRHMNSCSFVIICPPIHFVNKKGRPKPPL
jgi:hypothetical protein